MGSETKSTAQGSPSPFSIGAGCSGWTDEEDLPDLPSSFPFRRHLWAHIQAQDSSSAPQSALHIPAPPWILYHMEIGNGAAFPAPPQAAAQKELSGK